MTDPPTLYTTKQLADAAVELADNFRVYVDDDPASEAAQDIAADVSNEAERIFNSGSFWIEQS